MLVKQSSALSYMIQQALQLRGFFKFSGWKLMRSYFVILFLLAGCLGVKSPQVDIHLRDVSKFICGKWKYHSSTIGIVSESLLNMEYPPVLSLIHI